MYCPPLKTLCTLSLLSILGCNTIAQLPAQSGEAAKNASQIAQQSFALPRPDTLRLKVRLLLMDARGAGKRVRIIEFWQQEQDELSRQLIEFISPQDVAGTKYQSRKYEKYTETQIFTPGDRKVRTIGSSSKKNSFMGTDFSYYDLEHHDYEDFRYKLRGSLRQIRDKSFQGRYFYTIETVPKDDAAPYDMMLYWIDTETFQTRRIEAFVKGVKVKDTYVLKNIAEIPYLIPQILLTINLEDDGHRTVWQALEWEINPVLDERLFSLQNLK